MRFNIFVLFLFISTAAFALEDNKHIPVGERINSIDKIISIQEKRSCDDERPEGELQEKVEDEPLVKAFFSRNYPYSSHWIVGVSASGDTVELNDGSTWQVYAGHAKKTLKWYTSDDIIIEANYDRLSYFQYKLTNRTLGQSVKAKMVMGPFYEGGFTLWIVNKNDSKVWLSDGSVWNLSSFDIDVYYRWMINDTIVVGKNYDFLNLWNKYILINVNTDDYARGSLKHW